MSTSRMWNFNQFNYLKYKLSFIVLIIKVCSIMIYMGDFQKNEDFSFSENNLNIKWYERKVNILKQAQW